MWGLSVAFLIVAVVCGHWLRTLIRSRGTEIPCTSGVLPIRPVLVGVCGLFAMAGGSGIVIAQLHLFGAGSAAFIAYLVSMSAAAILFIMAVATAHTNRVALVWISLSPPNQLIVRPPGGTDTVTLETGCVRAAVVGNGAAGPTFVQYFVAAGERTLNLVVPFTIRAARTTEGAPWLAQYTGAVVQGRIKDVHRFLEPYCANAESGSASG